MEKEGYLIQSYIWTGLHKKDENNFAKTESKLGQEQHCFSVQNLPKGECSKLEPGQTRQKNDGRMRLSKLKAMHRKSLESNIN